MFFVIFSCFFASFLMLPNPQSYSHNVYLLAHASKFICLKTTLKHSLFLGPKTGTQFSPKLSKTVQNPQKQVKSPNSHKITQICPKSSILHHFHIIFTPNPCLRLSTSWQISSILRQYWSSNPPF
jgi:hypothetical protein